MRCKGGTAIDGQRQDQQNSGAGLRGEYERQLAEIRRGFELTGDGLRAATARSAFVDQLILRLWAAETIAQPRLNKGIAITAVGGFGRRLLFPYSDVDILFCVDKSVIALAKLPIRILSQQLWDCGLQVSINTRMASDCERFEPGNPEFAISLLDLRLIGGDPDVFLKLQGKSVAKLRNRDAKPITVELARLTQERHNKYGRTLFHLEPNMKDCPGGLRDANVSEWLRSLRKLAPEGQDSEFRKALAFLAAVRCFLHYRHQRDDNTLDWLAQDAAAEQGIGLDRPAIGSGRVDAAYWMRAYFRHARIIERCLIHDVESSGLRLDTAPTVLRIKVPANPGFKLEGGRIELAPKTPEGFDSARDPETVLAAFAAIACTAVRFSPASEERIGDAIPLLSANLEEGPGLWHQLSVILTGERAGVALRSMHALGMLELILPEFHGIDALVIRDAYHRYTVDEHTFVLIDTLHDLETRPPANAPEWRIKFGTMIRELQNPALLYLAALLHDTGKGHAGEFHAAESARMARNVLERMDMDSYDGALILRLIESHLDMSAALRRDIFDTETIRMFAAKIQTHEALRMLTLFTYADIAAVHPDALTPWKAENLWRLSMAAANYLDRNVDEDRFHSADIASKPDTDAVTATARDKLARVLSLNRGHEAMAREFFEGFPERYVSTRTPEVMAQHFQMSRQCAHEPFQIAFQRGAVSEITLVTQDRPRLFAGMAAALAAWGMDVVTADAFANSAGLIVDTFRFTDTFRTLELNQSEHERFVVSVRELVSGQTSVEKLLSSRRRIRRKAPRVVAETRIELDNKASSHSTLVQVIAQDIPGLLRAVSETFSALDYNLEVALIDTEGETAIDVFYITFRGHKLDGEQIAELRTLLLNAINKNASAA